MATKKTNISISVNGETKEKAQKLFEMLGLDMSGACNMFLTRCVIENGIPFSLSANDIANNALDFFQEWCGCNVLNNETLVKYFEHENINVRRLHAIDLVRILDAMICVTGQCGGFEDDTDFFSNMKDVLSVISYPDVAEPYDAYDTEYQPVSIVVPVDNRKYTARYTLSPYVSHLVAQLPELSDANDPLQAPRIIVFLLAACEYLDSFAYMLCKADKGDDFEVEYWTKVLFNEVHSVENALKSKMPASEYAAATSCEELRDRIVKTLHSAPKERFSSKYGMFIVNQAIDEILAKGYRVFTEENKEQLYASIPTDNASMANTMRSVYNCCLEMCASQDSNEIFAIIADEANYRQR